MSRRRKILILAVAALVASGLIPVFRHYQLRAATAAYIAELKAKGEPMELAQVIPPPVPPEQNGANIFRNATELLHADKSLLKTNSYYGMKMVAPGKAMICWQQSDVRGYDVTNSWGDVAAAVAQNEKAIELLHQIIDKPDFDFQLKYEHGIADMVFTNLCLSESKQAAQRLETAVLCDLHSGNTASAVKNLRAMLAVVKAMRDERLVISELVRIALAQIALTANWEILQSPNLTDEQLPELQNDWTGLNFVRGEENALAMERVTSETTLTKWRKSDTALQNYFNTWFTLAEPNKRKVFFDRAKLGIQIFRWRYWWSYTDELQLMKGYQIFLETARLAETNYSLLTALREQDNQVGILGIDTNSTGSLYFTDVNRIDLHSVLSGSVFSLSRVLDKAMNAEAAKQMAITAIALKRYQLKHGNYPADLNSLVPEFLPAVPLDPVDGQPLRYRPNADGTFLLYSVGENGKDDGGDPSLEKGVTGSSFYWQNYCALDWVWPQPATAEEIQKYYAQQNNSR
jgi:hypothetical protein